MSTEVELNLRLDTHCRTTFDPSSVKSEESTATTINYSTKTVLTSLADEVKVKLPQCSSSSSCETDDDEKQKLWDDLLFDCEITDCALLPRTFWMPCTGVEPRCTLERCAMEVFNHHVKPGYVYDPSTSGAEWWVQIRPSPPGGRYKMLVQDAKKEEKTGNEKLKNDEIIGNVHSQEKRKNDNVTSPNTENEEITDTGICFHWDKDEDLRLLMGGDMYIHPHISTVTYLTHIGAPTMALNYRVNSFTGEYIAPNEDEYVEGYISWPKKGKHLSFDGRFLHAAPSNFMKKGLFEKQIELPLNCISQINKDKSTTEKNKKILKRRHRRVTFLVNIWLNYKPFNVDVFPESMIDKLSKTDPNKINNILFKNDEESAVEENKQCSLKDHVYDGRPSENSPKYDEFQWSMGSCIEEKETIRMKVPIEMIQEEIGENIKMRWSSKETQECGIKLSKEEQNVDIQQEKKQRIK